MEKALSPAEFRAVWAAKPVLRAVYGDYYRRMSEELAVGSPVVEIGAGSGNLKEAMPAILSSDIVHAPWLELVMDAQALPFSDGSVANLVGVDILHHVEYPRRFLAEAERVLKPGGRVVLVEPGITPLSRVLFKLGHPEPVDMRVAPLADGRPNETERATEHIEVSANQAHMGNLLSENDPEADAPMQPLADPVQTPGGAPAMSRPPVIRHRPGQPVRQAPPVDAYSLRLVAVRTLYDAGSLVSRSPSLAALAEQPCLRANPADLGRMGVKTGDRVRVSSSRKSLVLDVAADPHVLRGSAVLAFNAPGDGACDLIDATQPFTDLRVETVVPSGRERETT